VFFTDAVLDDDDDFQFRRVKMQSLIYIYTYGNNFSILHNEKLSFRSFFVHDSILYDQTGYVFTPCREKYNNCRMVTGVFYTRIIQLYRVLEYNKFLSTTVAHIHTYVYIINNYEWFQEDRKTRVRELFSTL
jgi:hypothetical protein